MGFSGDLDSREMRGLGQRSAIPLQAAVVIHRVLNKPKCADMLIETEAELRKVTWPSMSETWAGALAVAVTVVLLLAFLTLSDHVLFTVLVQFIGGVR